MAKLMNLLNAAVICATTLLLSACAHLPDAKFGYFLPETTVKIAALRTVACSDDDHLFVATTITPSASSSAAQESRKYVEIDLNQLSGPFSDATAKLERYEDGRLKGWNSSTTGRGEDAIKSVLSLATVATGGAIKPAIAPLSACNFVRKVGKDGALSISYSTDLDLNKTSQSLTPDTKSQGYAAALAHVLPTMTITQIKVVKPEKPVSYVKKSDNEPVIKALEPGLLYLNVTDDSGNQLWSGAVPVAQLGTPYDIPIPKPALFGKLSLNVAFAESGALDSIEYLDTNGVNQLTDSLTELSKATNGDTTASKVADAKNEADLIFQQQRLVLCKASPSTCK